MHSSLAMRRIAFASVLALTLSACTSGTNSAWQTISSSAAASSVVSSVESAISSEPASSAQSAVSSAKPVARPSSAAVSSVHAASSLSASVAVSAAAQASIAIAAPRVIRITAEDFTFTPNLLSVKKGEKVKLVIEGKSGAHGFAIPGLRINERVDAGQTISIDLPTDTAGSFDIVCSIPCGPGHREMRGKLVIQ